MFWPSEIVCTAPYDETSLLIDSFPRSGNTREKFWLFRAFPLLFPWCSIFQQQQQLFSNHKENTTVFFHASANWSSAINNCQFSRHVLMLCCAFYMTRKSQIFSFLCWFRWEKSNWFSYKEEEMFSHKVTAFLLLQFLSEVQGVHTHFWCGIKARPPAQREAYT